MTEEEEEQLRSLAYRIGWYIGAAMLIGLGVALIIVVLVVLLAVL